MAEKTNKTTNTAKPAAKKVAKPAATKGATKSGVIGILEINKLQYIGREGEIINTRIALSDKAPEVKLLALLDVDKQEFNYGKPYLKNKVEVEVGEIVAGEKVKTSKFKAKARYRRTVGSRAKFVAVKIKSLGA